VTGYELGELRGGSAHVPSLDDAAGLGLPGGLPLDASGTDALRVGLQGPLPADAGDQLALEASFLSVEFSARIKRKGRSGCTERDSPSPLSPTLRIRRVLARESAASSFKDLGIPRRRPTDG